MIFDEGCASYPLVHRTMKPATDAMRRLGYMGFIFVSFVVYIQCHPLADAHCKCCP